MSEDLRKPPVIDLEAILQPISEEKPSGENLQYADVYGEIREARRADSDAAQGEWKIELKLADYRRVIALAVPVLTTQTKDLQIAAWLTEALVKENGFVGLRDSLKLVSGLQEKFWETLFPELDEGDMEGRANAVEWMDTQTSVAIKQAAAITGGEGYSFFDYEDSKRFDIPDNIDTLDSTDQQRYKELQAQAEKENRVTGLRWRNAKTASRRVFYEGLNIVIEEIWAEYKEVNRVIEEKYDRNQMPGLNKLKKSLEEIETITKKLLEEKRVEEPDEVEEEIAEGEELETGAGATGGVKTAGIATASGAIQSRADALKRLADVAEYFRKNEPHSPVSYLIQRAVKWGGMPLENWLQDVIKDETIMFNLRQTLGFNTQLPDASNTPQQ